LLLRPPEPGDVKAIVAFMEWDVVKNLSTAPHPYLEEHAHAFLVRQGEGRAKGRDFAFAVTRKDDGAFAGMCGVHQREKGFELGYWLGRPYWGKGYATEAAAEVLAFSFRNLRAEAVEAGWFHDNAASGRVLEKVGFRSGGANRRDCAARGESVLCNLVIMSRAEFAQRQAA
jgi:RimJ/RimL family protein N-acetyltransferase